MARVAQQTAVLVKGRIGGLHPPYEVLISSYAQYHNAAIFT
jgi:hypothetical protein